MNRYCENCGSAMAPNAVFCRDCGARYEEPAPAPVAPGPTGGAPGKRSRTALWIGAVIVLIGAGAAVAILLSRGGDSSRTTVLVDQAGRTTTVTTEASTASESDPPEPVTPVSGAVEAGRYVQAGSFRTRSHAEQERERLAAAGVDVEVISSDGTGELYPGFQVLLGGPFEDVAQERSLIKALKGDGVPSAFARDLSPAPQLDGASDAAGRWAGTLERSSGERPSLNDSLSVTVEIDPDGSTGTLEAEGRCSELLTLSEEGPATLTYSQDAPCVSGGSVFLRPVGDELMVAMLPLGTDIFVTGTLSRE